ncbi:hypothetical protein, partial [Enterobacter hormaechei]
PDPLPRGEGGEPFQLPSSMVTVRAKLLNFRLNRLFKTPKEHALVGFYKSIHVAILIFVLFT